MSIPTIKLLEEWKKKLLDLSKRNSLMNYKATKRGSLQIIYPEYHVLFSELMNEKSFSFAKPNEKEQFESFEPDKASKLNFNIRSSKDELDDEITTLRSLRRKTKTIVEEQGINILHLTFGQLKWKESENATDSFSSPLVLVPVSLNLESVVSPFVLELQDDDVTVNPTLKYKLEHDFNLQLPEFDQEEGLESFFCKCRELVSNQVGWSIDNTVFLSTFSYLKINMYNDLSCNESVVCENPIVKALSGDISALPDTRNTIEEVSNLNFDKDINPADVYQVLDADSSQQEAIELAKRGVSYVLQGPPGTGKSQTITNIIAECLAKGKKILFVSEKEAALNVVKNRLQQTGIFDFCLSVHSHKANKKELINELYRTAGLQKKKFKEENLIQLERLYENRNKLNLVSEELHKDISPLQKSVFSVNGELSSLESYQDIVFDYSNVDSTDQTSLSILLNEVTLLTNAISAFRGDRFSPLWSDCILSFLSNQNKTDFHAKISPAVISRLKEITRHIHNVIGNNTSVSWLEIDDFVSFLDFCSTGSPIPESWLETNLEEIKEIATNWKKQKEEVSYAEEITKKIIGNIISTFNAAELKNNIDGLTAFLLDSTKLSVGHLSSDGYFSSLDELANKTKIASNLIDKLYSLTEDFEELKINIDEKNLLDVEKTSELFTNLSSINHINSLWFLDNALETIRQTLDNSFAIFNKISETKFAISNRFDDSIYCVDVSTLLPKFRTAYGSIFRIFNSSYKKDLLQLKGHEKTGKLNYSGALDILNRLKNLQENEKTLLSYTNTFEKYFEITFVNNASDLEIFSEECSRLEQIKSFYSNNIPYSVRSFILDGKAKMDSFKESLELLNSVVSDKDALSTVSCFATTSTNSKLGRIKLNILATKEYVNRIQHGITLLKEQAIVPLSNLAKLDSLVEWETYVNHIHHESKYLEKKFGSLFQRESTDWQKILSSLQWFTQYQSYKEHFKPLEVFSKAITSEASTIAECFHSAKAISANKSFIKDSIEWFSSWFGESARFLNVDISECFAITQFYFSNIEKLDEWLSIKRAINKCSELGLRSFIDNVVNNANVNCEDYLGIFKKRFYSLWLDKFQHSLPTISSMSKVELNSLIENFKSQDTEQFLFAKHRIYQILSSQLPNVDFTYGANDQLSILRREYNKKRRQLSLRKLFNQIPTLIQQIKPCLMMSPLSVSLLLQNKDYHFDIVIFDEASQVKPENAIGSIIRGEQLIVAGDTHQLPPTSFFEKTTNDEELYDNDEETESYALEESILDASANILPERYLKWHYRSRHEHLIAFSNAKIYDNRLTTFPSVTGNTQHNGVEFEFVSNGVYDRSGKRNNLKEAQKVADLVFEHFSNHPERSLGVISNSEAQARAIEDIIFKMREQKQSYESFFNEERNEPFFIKSLESVQGDERDTIIFSVGYGKDSTGKMYNSFGPINLDGGERRLNVAVTRAKHNIKLVSSINADDIVITENSKQGPRLLKAYIDFAKRGMEAITGEISDGHSLSFDSPFEESVYAYLTEKGYTVESQVGCAGYRIDLGIKDPDMPGRYVLAVECDGATYHSSKYARERDRLRQNVLENIGWKFYRVWSTEWIKHTAQEKQRLLDAVNDAIKKKNQPNVTTPPRLDAEENLSETVVEENEYVLFSDGYQYEEYHESDNSVWNYKMSYERIDKILEVEAPMHIDYLCRKMAPHFGREKVTSVVRDKVIYDLNHHLQNRYEVVNDFIYKKPKKSEYPIRKVAGRDISFIAPEELQDIMMQVANRTIGISPKDLINQTGHVIGYAHCKERIVSILNSIFNKLKNEGSLTISLSGSVLVKKGRKNNLNTHYPGVSTVSKFQPNNNDINSLQENSKCNVTEPLTVSCYDEEITRQINMVFELNESLRDIGSLPLYDGIIVLLGCIRNNAKKMPFDYIADSIEKRYEKTQVAGVKKKLEVARDMISLLKSTNSIPITLEQLVKKYKRTY